MHVCPRGPLKGDKSQMGMLERFGSVSLRSFLVVFLVPVFSCSNLALRSWNKIFFPLQSLLGRVCVSIFSSAGCDIQRCRGLTVFILLRSVML